MSVYKNRDVMPHLSPGFQGHHDDCTCQECVDHARENDQYCDKHETFMLWRPNGKGGENFCPDCEKEATNVNPK